MPRAYLAAPLSPLTGTLSVAVASFFAGVGWEWQVRHDWTFIWALAEHTFLLMVMSLFGL